MLAKIAHAFKQTAGTRGKDPFALSFKSPVAHRLQGSENIF